MARTWEKDLGFFVLFIVGVVVAQTWHDWKRNSKDWVLPEWMRGIALGGVIAVSIAAASSFAMGWITEPAGQSGNFLNSSMLPEMGLVVISATTILLLARKRRMPWLILLGGMVLAAFWVGIVIGS